jgi:hypothetical protein
MNKPIKRKDNELFEIIESKINNGLYFITNHARERMIERGVPEDHILHILLGKRGYKRARNKAKDTYEAGKYDWKYCFEGYVNTEEKSLRVIVSFEDGFMPIITVIWL